MAKHGQMFASHLRRFCDWATALMTGGSVFDLRLEKNIFLWQLQPTQSSVQWVRREGGAVFSVGQDGWGLQLTIPSNVKVERDFAYAVTPLHFFAGIYLNQFNAARLPLVYGRVLTEFCAGFTKETNHSEDVGIDYRMVTSYEVRLSVVGVVKCSVK